jgi:hypothetical protein
MIARVPLAHVEILAGLQCSQAPALSTFAAASTLTLTQKGWLLETYLIEDMNSSANWQWIHLQLSWLCIMSSNWRWWERNKNFKFAKRILSFNPMSEGIFWKSALSNKRISKTCLWNSELNQECRNQHDLGSSVGIRQAFIEAVSSIEIPGGYKTPDRCPQAWLFARSD